MCPFSLLLGPSLWPLNTAENRPVRWQILGYHRLFDEHVLECARVKYIANNNNNRLPIQLLQSHPGGRLLVYTYNGPDDPQPRWRTCGGGEIATYTFTFYPPVYPVY